MNVSSAPQTEMATPGFELLNVGRWVGVLPLAIIGGLLAAMCTNLVNKVTLHWEGLNPDAFLFRLYIEAAGSAAFSLATIYVGTRIAPSHKTVVALALAGIMVMLGGFSTFLAVVTNNWWGVYGCVVGVVTAIAHGWSIHSTKNPDLAFF